MTEISSVVIPTTDQPKTRDDYETLLRRFNKAAYNRNSTSLDDYLVFKDDNLVPANDDDIQAGRPWTQMCDELILVAAEHGITTLHLDAKEAREAFLAKPVKELVQILKADALEYGEVLDVVPCGNYEWYEVRYTPDDGTFSLRPLCEDYCNQEQAWRDLAARYYGKLGEE